MPRFTPSIVCWLIAICIVSFPAYSQEKKEKDPLEGKKGRTLGIVVAKEKINIEVKADGEEKARKFFPEWRGGQPAQGGGLDKEILKIFSEIKVGSRVQVDWVFHERLRALKIEVLREPEAK